MSFLAAMGRPFADGLFEAWPSFASDSFSAYVGSRSPAFAPAIVGLVLAIAGE